MSGKQAAISNENWGLAHTLPQPKRSVSPKKRSMSPKKQSSTAASKGRTVNIHEYMNNLTGIRSNNARVFRNAVAFEQKWKGRNKMTAKERRNMQKNMRALRGTVKKSAQSLSRFHNKYSGEPVQYRTHTLNTYLSRSAIPHDTDQYAVAHHMTKSKMRNVGSMYSKGMTGFDPVREE